MSVAINFGDARLPERFWNKCTPCPMSGCWLWFAGGSNSAHGYGYYSIATSTNRGAHVVAFETLTGACVPAGMEIDHRCRVRCCVNPAHLAIETSRTNTLLGAGPTAINARKTHCAKGHDYKPDGRGQRFCPICRRERRRLAYKPREYVRKNPRRENGWARAQREKTHCPRGHEYAGDNLRITKQGHRGCRTCERAAAKAFYWARKSP